MDVLDSAHNQCAFTSTLFAMPQLNGIVQTHKQHSA